MDIFHPQKQNTNEPQGEHEDLTDEKEKKVKISKQQKFEPVSNFSEKDDEARKHRDMKKMIFFKAGAVFVLFTLLFGAVWGYGMFEKYAKKVLVEELLPGNANIVMEININPQALQYQLLDKHFEKFPGNKMLMKELDQIGEGITISQYINKKIAERGIDFDQDLKDALDEQAYVVVTSLEPVEEYLQQKILVLKEESLNSIKNHLALSEESVQNKIALGSKETKVLGSTTDFFLMSDENAKGLSQPLDFVVGAQIKSLREAKQAIDKMASNKERYGISSASFAGYKYFKVIDKQCQSNEKTVFDLRTSFHALVGSNWLMASNEEEIKKMISRHRSTTMFGGLRGKLQNFNKTADVAESLGSDSDFNEVISNVASSGGSQLASIFYRFDPSKIFGNSNADTNNPLKDIQNFFKYPEKITGSFLVMVQDDGVNIRLSSNQHSLEQKDNKSFMEGLVNSIPNNLDGRWADIYLEYDNPKSMYYSFKRNNLSEEGLKKWNETIEMVKQSIAIDLETDLIDQVSGDVAFVGYTGRGLKPETIVVVGIENEERILASLNKLLELGKQMYLGMSPYAHCFAPLPSNNGSIIQDQEISTGMNICSALEKSPDQKKIIEQQYKAVKNSAIRQTQTDSGTIYSYNLPGTELSFDFSFKDGQLFLGSHYAAVESILREYGNNPENVIATNKYYKQVGENVFPEGYTRVCINSLGLWNSVEYYLSQFGQRDLMAIEEFKKEHEDNMFAIGSIVKTIKLLGASDAISQSNGNVMSSVYFNIEEQPAEQKEKAERIMQNW